MKKSTIALTALLLTFSCSFAQHITVTIAGNGSATFTGDGVWSKFTGVGHPYDVCTDAMNNLYYTDQTNGRVVKISAQNGMITTIAGGGTSTASGIPALSALLAPRNMCIDASGNIYVVNNATEIERIDAVTNVITTIAGSATAGYSGDGGPAIAAKFKDIFGICADAAGNIYLVDEGNNRIRKITASTGIVTTIGGDGSGSFSGDGGPATAAKIYNSSSIMVDPSGDVYFMDQTYFYYARFRKIDAATGIITTVAGSSTAAPFYNSPLLGTQLGKTTGVCRDHHGRIHCNEISCTCRRMDFMSDSIYLEGGANGIESFSDNQGSQQSWMNDPYGICVDANDNLYVADYSNNRIRKMIQLTTTPTFAYGAGEFISACTGTGYSLDSLMSIVDIDSLATETWSVLSAPAHGTLSGFPATAVSSTPLSSLTVPGGTSYMANTDYSGPDSFKIQVSNGTLSSVLTVYTTVNNLLTTGPGNICSTAAPVAYTATLPGATWSMTNANASISSSGVVTAVSAGTDTIICSASTAICGAFTYDKVVTIYTAAPATAGTISGSTALCLGSTNTFADGVSRGTWSASNSNCIMPSPGVFQAETVGTDTLLYTVSNVCGSTSTGQAVVVTNCDVTGIPTTSSAAGIRVYPNPASSTLTIQWDALPAGNATITISDIAGNMLISHNTASNGPGSVTENLSALTDGIYMLSISCGTIHYADKLVISK